MAGLLERQGDARSAERIRAALDGAPTGSGPEAVIGELERWLRNAQRARGDRL